MWFPCLSVLMFWYLFTFAGSETINFTSRSWSGSQDYNGSCIHLPWFFRFYLVWLGCNLLANRRLDFFLCNVIFLFAILGASVHFSVSYSWWNSEWSLKVSIPFMCCNQLWIWLMQVRVNALLCLGEVVPRLDKVAIHEILQTLQRCTAVDHSAPTLMCSLGVASAIHKQVSSVIYRWTVFSSWLIFTSWITR